MPLTRAQSVTYLAGAFDVLALDVGVTATDDAVGWGLAVDAALRALGTAEADLATATASDSATPAYLAVLRYFALDHLAAKLLGRVSTTTEAGLKRERQQAYANVVRERDLARARAEATGFLSAEMPAAVLHRVSYADPYGAEAMLLERAL